MKRFAGLIFRALIPLVVLAGGIYGYRILSVEPEEAKSGPPAPQMIRTQVATLETGQYPVVVRTHGVVQPHNLVTLSAEVSGEVSVVNQQLQVGSYFDENDVLIEIDNRDHKTTLEAARARLRLAQSSFKLAESTHKRILKLSRSSATSAAQLDQSSAALAQAQADIDIATSEIDQATRDLERTIIRAPFSGRVQSKSVGVGQLLAAGTPIAEVFAVDYAEVRLPIAGRDLKFLKLPEMENDPPVEVTLRDAIDSTSETVWKATIVRTEGSLDRDSLELFAIARIADPFGLESERLILRIGQPVVADIAGEVLADVISVPRSAVRQLDQIHLVDEQTLTLKTLTIDPIWSDELHVVVRAPSIPEDFLLATTQLVYAPEGAQVEIIPDIDVDTPLAAVPASDQ